MSNKTIIPIKQLYRDYLVYSLYNYKLFGYLVAAIATAAVLVLARRLAASAALATHRDIGGIAIPAVTITAVAASHHLIYI